MELVSPDYDQVFNNEHTKHIVVRNSKLLEKNIVVNVVLNPKERCLVGCPSKAKVEEIFIRLRKRIYGFGKYLVNKDVSKPFHEILLSNASIVRGFGLNGPPLKGQSVDHIYISQTEKIENEVIIGSILPLLVAAPKTKIIFFFDKKTSENWSFLSNDKDYRIHDFSTDEDEMIVNPFTGRKSWL